MNVKLCSHRAVALTLLDWSRTPICILTLVLMLMLGVSGGIETNVFFPSVNTRVNAEARCE